MDDIGAVTLQKHCENASVSTAPSVIPPFFFMFDGDTIDRRLYQVAVAVAFAARRRRFRAILVVSSTLHIHVDIFLANHEAVIPHRPA